jgi:hypothetical protein
MSFYDTLVNARSSVVSQASMNIIDRLQTDHAHPGEQVAAACAVFLITCEEFGIPAQEVFTATKNLMNGPSGKRPVFKAVSDYFRHEVAPRSSSSSLS